MHLIIHCQRSGTPIAKMESLCANSWPLLNSFNGQLLHPIYNLSFNRLIIKLRDGVDAASYTEWLVNDRSLLDIKLTMSAIMYALDAIWSPASELSPVTPSLPSDAVAVGCAARLLALAQWYHFATSKRVKFPIYRVSAGNKNTDWGNYSAWLEDAESVWKDWASAKATAQQKAEIAARKDALLTVRAVDIYHRLDIKKIWNWMDVQLAANKAYPLGRRETFKELFTKGDLSPEDWTADDVDDLVEAVLLCCDAGNEISHFIHKRLSHIRESIIDFFSSFTILKSMDSDKIADVLVGATEQETALLNGFNDAVNNLEELPMEPQRKDYASMGLFMKAQAEWRILARRFNNRKQ